MSSIAKCTTSSIVLIVLIASNGFGQVSSGGYEIGINAGTLIYQGELTPKFYGYTKSLKPAVGVYVSKSVGSYFSVRANLTRGKILADESRYTDPAWRQLRNLKFSSSVTELSSTLVFNPFGQNNENGNHRFSTYFFAGAGIALLNVKRDWSGFNTIAFDDKSSAAISLAADTVHSVPKAVAVLPVGIGFKYILSERLALNAETTWRLTSSDYVDGFKYQGDKNHRDSYYGISLGLSFRLGKNKYDCPTISRY